MIIIMFENERHFLNPIVGDRVRVQVPNIIRAKTDAQSVLVCIMDVSADYFFKL